MSLSDQEQVILKAIGLGVAQVSHVLRGVGYPKATTKKILARLNEKGIVALHRHDYPQSLKPEQRKLMLRLKDGQGRWAYYNAVSMRKRNPKGNHLRGATAKQQRQYEAIKRSELKRGESRKTAKRIAAATVRKQAKKKATKRKRNKTIIKAKTIDHVTVVKARNPKKRNASRVGYPKRSSKKRAGASSAGRKATKARSRKPVAKARKASTKRATRNPSPESVRKEFAGAVSGSRDLFFPKGTPRGLAKLGKLVSITTEEGTIKPVSGTAWLCADTKEKLHIGSTNNAPLFDGPARSFGKVSKVEYESSKPHLGYRGPIIWFHHMGEESGHKPTLHADGHGGLVFRGGQYRLTKRGIEN